MAKKDLVVVLGVSLNMGAATLLEFMIGASAARSMMEQ